MKADVVKMRGKFRRKGCLTILRRMWFKTIDERRMKKLFMSGACTYIGAVMIGKHPSDLIHLVPQDAEVMEIK